MHGDYRIDNTILAVDDVTAVQAVVDWELSTLGDPLTDVALMCVYRQPVLDLILGEAAAWSSDRLPTPEELAEEYAREAGVPLDGWPFYLGLANFKLAIIAEGISYRARMGSAADATAAMAARATPELIATGLRTIKHLH